MGCMQKTSSRLLSLLSLLQTHRDWSGQDLAERLLITVRTVRRDIDRLRELGYLISTVKGPGGGYRLEAGTQMPPMLFDDGQARALGLALQGAATDTTATQDDARGPGTRPRRPPAGRRAGRGGPQPRHPRPRGSEIRLHVRPGRLR